MHRIGFVGLVAGLCLAAFCAGVPARAAEDLKQDWQICDGATGEQAIAACTALIESGTLSSDDLALVYDNRGMTYYSQGKNDLARQDLDRACQLDDLRC